jgi:hypothetical protein
LKIIANKIKPDAKPKEVWESLPSFTKSTKYKLDQFCVVYGCLKQDLKMKGKPKNNSTFDCCFVMCIVIVVVVIVVIVDISQ